ncbi:MAG TPA: hypothetical protein VFV86_11020 [Nitrososphaeraceae archaeon]|nr:hypothetical protein [Nitrososphaeraceae archaeon]
MNNEKLSQEELNNIKKMEQSLKKDSKYIKIEPNTSKTLRFILSEEMGPISKTYNEKPFEQYSFIAIEENTDNIERRFEVGKRSAEAILEKLKEGYKVLNVERIGSGTGTMYIPRPASNESE